MSIDDLTLVMKCPYCGTVQDIGYFETESLRWSMESCEHCNKSFPVEAKITFTGYKSRKLNDAPNPIWLTDEECEAAKRGEDI